MLSPGSTYTEEFPATPASVPRARAAVAGFALAAGATGPKLDAIRLATSEGVTNSVLHAYGDCDGVFQVSVTSLPDELWLLIADDGDGMKPGRVGGLGLGLAVIAQMADDFQIVRRSSGGTELQMRFELRAPAAGSPWAEEPPQTALSLG